MTIAFVTNGLGAFGLRILAGEGLGGTTEIQYLTLWYALGFVTALAAYMMQARRPVLKEAAIGFGMAVCSLCGQLGMALSLSNGIPGFIVFPVATGGGLLFVVAVGRLIFREPMGVLGKLGILLGVVALIVLALPD
ncbi:MAG: hypothetical protein HUU41_20155 [Bryobacteraceae bacterium]|nr:hypothetical protein [Bryobacteraceae bacterium]